ncbi:hypothetical protein [Oleisolibacter albus]|uniref:hypothetical protein n=1 Tax=Oleisolibacter albus TaxID=2171757 RepID=UPI000DF1EAAD|nr:hypothetical protein [Oleisolibacter albus]
MLNELRAIERGLAISSIATGDGRHPDIKGVGKGIVLRVRLTETGSVAGVAFLPPEEIAALWTLRDGQQNSFPAVKRTGAKGADWCSETLRRRVGERRDMLAVLADSPDTASVPATFSRFLTATEDPEALWRQIADAVAGLVTAGNADNSTADKLINEGGTLYFDVAEDGFNRDARSLDQAPAISAALFAAEKTNRRGVCALTGGEMELADKFPQPNLPILGQTYLFSKNSDLPAVNRYGLTDAFAMPVGRDTIGRLQGAIETITADWRQGKTWHPIPGEKPKQSDLLIAFVTAAPDQPIVPVLAPDGDEPMEEADYLRRTDRIFEALAGKPGVDFSRTPVQVCVLRKVDPGNHKTVLHRAVTVRNLKDARDRWAAGEGNLPHWLSLPVWQKARQPPLAQKPPHIDPLDLPRLTRVAFIRGGKGRADIVGVPAAEALALFLGDGNNRLRAVGILRLVLARYGPLIGGIAHSLRRDHSRRQDGSDAAKAIEKHRIAALQGLTLFGILLKIIRSEGEEYMKDAAFKLGQFLSVADRLHLGYCEDVRGGATPPTLLGSSVLAMAQANPLRALALLCQRWKPYASWAQLPQTAKLADDLLARDRKSQKGLAIRTAVSQVRRAKHLVEDLKGILTMHSADDAFRAELLLGYIAGLEPVQSNNASHNDPSTTQGE